MAGLSKETRTQILQFLWEVHRDGPTRIVRGKELMERLQIDEYTLEANLKLLSDFKWIRLLSNSVNERAFVKITDMGLRQIDCLSDG